MQQLVTSTETPLGPHWPTDRIWSPPWFHHRLRLVVTGLRDTWSSKMEAFDFAEKAICIVVFLGWSNFRTPRHATVTQPRAGEGSSPCRRGRESLAPHETASSTVDPHPTVEHWGGAQPNFVLCVSSRQSVLRQFVSGTEIERCLEKHSNSCASRRHGPSMQRHRRDKLPSLATNQPSQ